jgi:FkbM family methyltransferase
MKLSRNRDTKIGLKQIAAGFKIIKLIKNWPTYFKDFLGKYKDTNLVYKFRNGIQLLIKSDSFERNMINEIWVYEEYNPEGFEINKNDIIMDIGANVGVFTVYAASKASEGKVYAFEPVKENFDRLKDNAKLNNLKNVVAYNAGVSDKTGNKDIMVSGINTGGHSFYITGGENRQKFSIKTISLKDVFAMNKIDRINFLKCDCEGAEYEILFSAPELLKRIDKISMEVHALDEKRDVQTMKNFLEKNGFDVRMLYPGNNGLNVLYAKRIEITK